MNKVVSVPNSTKNVKNHFGGFGISGNIQPQKKSHFVFFKQNEQPIINETPKCQ